MNRYYFEISFSSWTVKYKNSIVSIELQKLQPFKKMTCKEKGRKVLKDTIGDSTQNEE